MLLAFVAFSPLSAVATGGVVTAAEAVGVAYEEVWKRFVSPQGVVYDYVGELPTPKDCAEGRPNAIGWWSPIENGPMFTGPFLGAMVRRAKRTGREEDRARCRRLVEGLMLCADVCGTPGMICRGVGSDGKCHYPLGSVDQTYPWFYGIDAYLQSGFGEPEFRSRVRATLVRVAEALERTDWRLPCDGIFAKEFRGNLKADSLCYRGAAHYLFALRALYDATKDERWLRAYRAARDEKYPGGYAETRLDVCAYGYRFDREVCRVKFEMEPLQFWIYVGAQEAVAALSAREEDPKAAAAYREGLRKGATWAKPFVETAFAYDNRAVRPFGYANWRQGWKWREQKTQKDAEAVSQLSVREVLGNRKNYERRYVTTPLAAAVISALGGADYRETVERVLCHYDYTTPNISEFFLAAVAYEAMQH